MDLRNPGFAAAVLDALPDATAVLDPFGTIVAVNRAWRMFAVDNGGTPETTGVDVNYLDVCERSFADGCADAGEVLAGLRAVLKGETIESDWEYPCPSPTVGRWFSSRITPIGGSTGGAVISHVNISRRKMSEQQLAHKASHDSLTGLANRVLFTEKLTEMLTPRPGRSQVPDCGVLFIDLDEFKPVNDTFGHDAGDEVLLQVAHRIRAQMRPQDTAARLGGDEFAVCVPRIDHPGLVALANRVTNALHAPHRIHGELVSVGGSVGAHLALPGDSAAVALREADQAMYATKIARRS